MLTSAGAVETSFSISADGKKKIGILINDKGMPKYYAGKYIFQEEKFNPSIFFFEKKRSGVYVYATSETEEMFRGQMVAEKWRKDRWVEERAGIRLKRGAVQVSNFGKPRKIPTSLVEMLRNAISTSVRLCGFEETEILQQELRDRGVILPK
ncbi:hypothetical protein Aduo_009369 [Ancylostoma duodenale]